MGRPLSLNSCGVLLLPALLVLLEEVPRAASFGFGANKAGAEAQTIEAAKARCLGAPYPLVFGTVVHLPTAELNVDLLEKKKAVGFFGGTVKDPSKKNMGTAATQLLKSLAGKGKKGKLGRRLLGKADSLPLLGRCAKEHTNKQLQSGEQGIEQCIAKPHKCADLQGAKTAVQGLKGMQALDKILKCLTVHRSCTTSGSMVKAPETGKQLPPSQQRNVASYAPMKDLPRTFQTCALVGNGPGLTLGGHKIGHVIDAHDAVFKFNMKNLGNRTGSWRDDENDIHGLRSDFRIMNRKRGDVASREEPKRGSLQPLGQEHWVQWNYGGYSFYKTMSRINPRSYFVSPEYQSWLLDSYFALRTDLYRLGIASKSKPLQCPVNVSSGIHGLWLAMQMCKTINMFGFSWNLNMLGDRTDGPSPRVSGSHSWDFDTIVLKFLALAGRVNLCTQ